MQLLFKKSKYSICRILIHFYRSVCPLFGVQQPVLRRTDNIERQTPTIFCV